MSKREECIASKRAIVDGCCTEMDDLERQYRALNSNAFGADCPRLGVPTGANAGDMYGNTLQLTWSLVLRLTAVDSPGPCPRSDSFGLRLRSRPNAQTFV